MKLITYSKNVRTNITRVFFQLLQSNINITQVIFWLVLSVNVKGFSKTNQKRLLPAAPQYHPAPPRFFKFQICSWWKDLFLWIWKM